MKTIRVKAAPGRSLPRERSRRRFTEEPIEVPETAYIRRALLRGDLLEAPVEAPKPRRKAAAGGED